MLHIKFEELYNDLFVKIGEITERILTLGHIPSYKFSTYLRTALIADSHEVTIGNKSIEQILYSLQIVLLKQRKFLTIAGNINDEGTSALMSDYIRTHEKQIWMYSAYLNTN